jgi:hypothetical protein
MSRVMREATIVLAGIFFGAGLALAADVILRHFPPGWVLAWALILTWLLGTAIFAFFADTFADAVDRRSDAGRFDHVAFDDNGSKQQ